MKSFLNTNTVPSALWTSADMYSAAHSLDARSAIPGAIKNYEGQKIN